MSHVKIPDVRCNEARLAIWRSGECPYCGSRSVTQWNITKKLRGQRDPEVGYEFTCADCGSVNTFTKRAKQ